MSLYGLKPRFQRLLRPLLAALAERGISPNQLTVVALLLSVLLGASISLWPTAHWPLLLLAPGLLLRMALNALDGMLAREYQQSSPLGAVLNELGDVLADVALYFPLAWVPGVPASSLVSFVVLGLLTEFAGLLGPLVGTSRCYVGPLGKADRALIMGGLGLCLGLGLPTTSWLAPTLWVATGLAGVTVLRRCQHILQEAPQ